MVSLRRPPTRMPATPCVPTFDHLASAETKIEQVAAVPAGIELLAVAPRNAGVVHVDALADHGLVTVADGFVLDHEIGGWFAVGDRDSRSFGHERRPYWPGHIADSSRSAADPET